MTHAPPTPTPDLDASVRAFMADPATHGGAKIEEIETHSARVFLVGTRAYKLKKPVALGYLDFSTLERREQVLRAELALNRGFAPQIYLDMIWVTRGPDGALALGGAGTRVEPVLAMQRFPGEALLSAIADRGGFDTGLARDLALVVSASHKRAPVHVCDDAAETLQGVLDDACDRLEAHGAAPAGRVEALRARLTDIIAARRGLIAARGRAGFVRRCHGDLHLGNIVMLDGAPVLFDALEFDESLATIDIAYDLAFLVMDMAGRGLNGPLGVLLSHYFALATDEGAAGAGLLAPLAAMRALVRALTRFDRGRDGDEAAALAALDLAWRFAHTPAPRLIAVGGLSGTGKSTLAMGLAPHLGGPAGALVLRADLERKALAGVAWDERLPPERYTKAASDAVYDSLRAKARAALDAGGHVILDAVHARPEERRVARDIAGSARFDGLWLEAERAVLEARVEARTGDASDATAEVVRAQLGYDLGEIDWRRIDASRGAGACLDAAREALGV